MRLFSRRPRPTGTEYHVVTYRLDFDFTAKASAPDDLLEDAYGVIDGLVAAGWEDDAATVRELVQKAFA